MLDSSGLRVKWNQKVLIPMPVQEFPTNSLRNSSDFTGTHKELKREGIKCDKTDFGSIPDSADSEEGMSPLIISRLPFYLWVMGQSCGWGFHSL